jgi:thioredoxin 1
MVHEIKTLVDFATSIGDKSTGLVVIDFHAKWCGPCKMIAPKYQALSEKYTDVLFCKIDCDVQELREACDACNISSMPTFCFFRKGKYVAKMVGANADNLEKLIIQHSAE